MLELLIMIGVVKTFASIADGKGLNKVVWGAIGAASYYGPILLMSFLILPTMYNAGLLPFLNEGNAFIMSLLINLATGISCCYMTFLFLKSSPNRSSRFTATEEE